MTAQRDFSLEEMLDYLKDRCGDVSLISSGSNWCLAITTPSGEDHLYEGSIRHVVSQAFRPFYADALDVRTRSQKEWSEMEKAVDDAFSNNRV